MDTGLGKNTIEIRSYDYAIDNLLSSCSSELMLLPMWISISFKPMWSCCDCVIVILIFWDLCYCQLEFQFSLKPMRSCYGLCSCYLSSSWTYFTIDSDFSFSFPFFLKFMWSCCWLCSYCLSSSSFDFFFVGYTWALDLFWFDPFARTFNNDAQLTWLS